MRKNRLKGIIALAILIISMVFMYLYLTFGQEALLTKSVLVSIVDIEQGTIISHEYFTEKKVYDDDLISGSIGAGQLSSIIGLASTQFIPANSQILGRYFEKPGIVVTGDKFVYKIPNNWIYAVPSSIRRSDEILIYEINSKIDQGINLCVEMEAPESMFGNTMENGTDNITDSTVDNTIENTTDTTKEEETDIISENTVDNTAANEILPIYEENVTAEIELSEKKPILQTTVIYVKDSANREVVDVDGGKRLDASSQVASIEIVCTKDDITKLEKKIAEGKKLIIVYR